MHDADGRVQEVRDGLPEKIRTRAEVGVEDGDEIGGGFREGMPQVPRFLELRTIRSTHVCVRRDGVREEPLHGGYAPGVIQGMSTCQVAVSGGGTRVAALGGFERINQRSVLREFSDVDLGHNVIICDRYNTRAMGDVGSTTP